MRIPASVGCTLAAALTLVRFDLAWLTEGKDDGR